MFLIASAVRRAGESSGARDAVTCSLQLGCGSSLKLGCGSSLLLECIVCQLPACLPLPQVRQALAKVPGEVLDKYYGCGSPLPMGIEGLR